MSDEAGKQSPSAARSFSPSQLDDLRHLAAALPVGWCVQVQPPHGQIAIVPILAGTRWYHDCLVVSPSGRAGPARIAGIR